MANNNTVNYQEERVKYYKVLIGLLLLTAVTFIQPYIFHAGTFVAQMAIAVVKAWLIIMYYMHLKGDKLIGAMGVFSLSLVAVFFIIVIAVDVTNFQFGAESYITSAPHAN
jgi:caa(3)-type oxidase subunit IV